MLQPEPLLASSEGNYSDGAGKKRSNVCASGWHQQHVKPFPEQNFFSSASHPYAKHCKSHGTLPFQICLFLHFLGSCQQRTRCLPCSPPCAPSCTLSGCSGLPGMMGTLRMDIHRQRQSTGRSSCEKTPMLQRELQHQGCETFSPEDASCSVSV